MHAEFLEVDKLVPTAASTSSRVGSTNKLAISGDWAVVGGREVFVLYRHQGGTNVWGVVKELDHPDGDLPGFASSLAISGDTVVIGASGETVIQPNDPLNTPVANAGAVYLYRRDQGGADNWGFFQRLIAGDGIVEEGDRFGTVVDISGDRLIIGSPDTGSTGNTGAGEVQVFREATNVWSYQYSLSPSDGNDGDGFGSSVALYIDRAVVASPFRYPDKKVYVFTVPLPSSGDPSPTPAETRIAPQGGADAPGAFGLGLDLQGTALVVRNGGTVEIFERNQGGTDNWGGVQTILGASSTFGSSVAVNGSRIIIGDTSGNEHRGAVSLYEVVSARGGDPWQLVKDLTAADGLPGDTFGSSVTLGPDDLLVGAPFEDNAEGNDAGSVYVFQDLPATDLSITNTDGQSTIPRGGSTTYTIQVSNDSAANVTGALVESDVILGSVDTASSSWTCAPDVGSTAATACQASGTVAQLASGILVDIGAGESLTILFEVTTEVSNPAATLRNEATVTPPSGLFDATPGNNSVLDTNTFVNEADLSVAVLASTDTPDAGDTIFVTATLTSAGPSQGTAQLQISLPPELTYVNAVLGGEMERGDSGPPCTEQSSRGELSLSVTCNTGISPGQSVVYEVELLVDGGFVGVAESLWGTFFFSGTDPNQANDEITLQTFVGVGPEVFSDGFETGSTSAWQ